MLVDAALIKRDQRDGRLRYIVLIALGLAVVGGVLANYYLRSPEITLAMRGKEVAEELGCFACHGPEGFGGIADPVSPAGRMPGWEKGIAVLYVDNEQEIEEWILHGKPLHDNPSPIELRPENLEPMPAYEGQVSKKELKQLVAYFKAVAEYFPEIPDQAYEGSVIANDLGCFGCHGPSGMGGIANPRSFTGIIPSWEGEHYEQLVESDDELREWILTGTSSRIMENPIGRFFLESQLIQMPAYREHLTDEELELLIIYIKWLRGHEAEDKQAENPIA